MIIETSDGEGNVIDRIDDGIPVEPDPPTPEVIAAQAISDEISSRMDEAATIGDVKLAVTDGLLAALATLRGEA